MDQCFVTVCVAQLHNRCNGWCVTEGIRDCAWDSGRYAANCEALFKSRSVFQMSLYIPATLFLNWQHSEYVIRGSSFISCLGWLDLWSIPGTLGARKELDLGRNQISLMVNWHTTRCWCLTGNNQPFCTAGERTNGDSVCASWRTFLKYGGEARDNLWYLEV